MKLSKLQIISVITSLTTLVVLAVCGYIISLNPSHPQATTSSTVGVTETITPITTTPDIVTLNETTEPYPDQMRQTVFTKVNDLRVSLGEKPLIRNKLLDDSACAKIDDEISNNYYSHISPSGVKPDDFIHDSGIGTKILAENLDKSVRPENLVSPYSDWRNSPEHYTNLVSLLYTDEGLCFKTDSKGYMLGAEHFIRNGN